jgi:transglutaminase-like putative cysteine protease
MLFKIDHITKLTYSAPVSETVFEARMAPPSTEDPTVLGYLLRTTPAAPLTSYRDGFGNRVDLFNLATPYRELTIHTTSIVRVHRRRFEQGIDSTAWPTPGHLTRDGVDVVDFLEPSPLVDRSERLDAIVASLKPPTGTFLDRVNELLHVVAGELAYEQRVTTSRTPLREVLELKKGVCQDFAHLMLGVCRGVGVPARYVSGYINHPGEIATHAWCQLWGGSAFGWFDVDPTRTQFVGDEHVVVAVGRDYSDVPPNRGLWKGRAEESINVTVQVEPIDRVPHDWNEWSSWGARGTHQSRSTSRVTESKKRVHVPYPVQRSRNPQLKQQQGQQQQ